MPCLQQSKEALNFLLDFIDNYVFAQKRFLVLPFKKNHLFFSFAATKLENFQFFLTTALIAVIILGTVMVMIGFIVNTVARLLAEVSLFHL